MAEVEIKVDGIYRPDKWGKRWRAMVHIPDGNDRVMKRFAGEWSGPVFTPEVFQSEAEAQARCDELNGATDA